MRMLMKGIDFLLIKMLITNSLKISGTTSPEGMDAEGESPRHGKKRSGAEFFALPGFTIRLVYD